MSSSPDPVAFGRITAIALLAAALAGCGLRVGHPPAPVPAIDEAQQWRQDAAIIAQRVLLAAEADPGGDEEARASLASAASTYLDALGGVWIPPPRDEDPSPLSPAVRDAPQALPPTLTQAAQDLLPLVHQSTEPQALLSMWLTWRSATAVFTGEPAPECSGCASPFIPSAFEEALLTGEPDPQVSALIDSVAAHAPELAGIYDALGYIEEHRAARAGGDQRDDVAAGAHALRRLADLLAGSNAGTPRDTRLSAYQFDADDPGGAARAYLASAAAEWLIVASHTSPEAFDSAVDAMWHSYALSAPAGHVETWPALGTTSAD